MGDEPAKTLRDTQRFGLGDEIGLVDFVPVGVVRVFTRSSIWVVVPGRYLRMPRVEAPRPPIKEQIEGRLEDGRWHGFRRAWWERYGPGLQCLWLLPVVGPVDGKGVHSGEIERIEGEWTAV